jgi:hypothetical protein
MNYAVEMVSCGKTHVPSFMKGGRDVQAILRLYLNSLRSCNVSVADGTDL